MNIGISGPIGAGKTTAAKYLASTHGLSYLRYSEILAEMSKKTDADKQTLRKLGWEIMSTGLQMSLNQKLLAKMKKEASYVVDGLRHPFDFETLSNQRPFYLLYIDAPPSIRWQRLNSPERFRTWDEFREADRHPVESYLPLLQEAAFRVLPNEESFGRLYVELDTILKEIERADRSTNID